MNGPWIRIPSEGTTSHGADREAMTSFVGSLTIWTRASRGLARAPDSNTTM